MTTPDPWPPYCGAERVEITYVRASGDRVHWHPLPGIDPAYALATMARIGRLEVDIQAICTRAPHPLTEQHVDIERGKSWPEPGHYVRNPFGQPA